MPDPLNIVLIHSHDTGRCVQPYGYDVATPRIQAFAEQGVLFRRAFAMAPTCSPSRAAMLAGQPPHCCGMFGLANAKYHYTLNDPSHHLARFLGSHGYATALCGIQHEMEGDDRAIRETLGYHDVFCAMKWEEPLDPATHEAAVEYVHRPHDRPFFLSVGFFETHRDNPAAGRRHSRMPGTPDFDDYDGRYRRPPAPIADIPITRRDWASFRHGALELDRKVGAVLDAIDHAGLADSTLVILTTDHGIAWPHGKGNLTDLGTGVMLMLRGPAATGFTGGRVLDAMVTHMDLYPTICELLAVEPPAWLHGKPLCPLIRGDAHHLHDQVFAEQNWHSSPDPQRSVRTERYRYIRRKDTPHLRIVDPGPTNQWAYGAGFAERPEGIELLYDLYTDPQEMVNRVDDPSLCGVLDDLRGRLDRWMDETDDPFPHGRIPPPPSGATALS